MTTPARNENKQLAASAGLGLSAGQVLVWLLEAFVLAEPIPAEVAIAIGSLLAPVLYKIPMFRKKEWDDEIDDINF